MALCIPMTLTSNDKSLPHNRHLSPHEIRAMYKSTLKKVRHMDLTNRMQLVEKLARSLSVEGVVPITKCTKTLNRTFSLFGTQTSFDESNDYLFSGISNDSQFFSIAEQDDQRNYSTKTPYPCPSDGHCLSSPPMGYKPIGIQLLARHGSRALNGHDYDIQTLTIWRLAQEINMLTIIGEQLKEDTELFMEENNRVG
jgi:hypothetical protein